MKLGIVIVMLLAPSFVLAQTPQSAVRDDAVKAANQAQEYVKSRKLAQPGAVGTEAAQTEDMVIVPRRVLAGAVNALALLIGISPELGKPVIMQAAQEAQACLLANPQPDGNVVRSGEDRCLSVTAAIRQRERELAELRAKTVVGGSGDKAAP